MPCVSTTMHAILARNVRRLRLARRLTLDAAAEQADLSPRYWQKIEAGEANATLATIAGLSVALDVPAEALFSAEKKKSTEP